MKGFLLYFNKIIYLSNSLIPSAQANTVHVMKMCNAFSSLGFETELLIKTTALVEDDVYESYSVRKNFKIKKFSVNKVIGRSAFVSFFLYPLYLFKRNLKDTLIYSRNRHASFILAFFKIPQFYETHGVPAGLFQRIMEQFICKSSSVKQVFVISEVLKTDLIDFFGVFSEKITVSHDAADPVIEDDLQPIILKGNFLHNVGYTGSFLPGKGVDLICNAAADLPYVAFHLVGGSSVEVDFYKSQYLNLDNLFFYGHVPQKDVARYILSFDVALLPNKKSVITSNNEDIGKYTSPLKLFEYIALGKKIVLSNMPVFKEILTDEQAFYYISENKISFVDAIRKSLTDNVSVYTPVRTWTDRVLEIKNVAERVSSL